MDKVVGEIIAIVFLMLTALFSTIVPVRHVPTDEFKVLVEFRPGSFWKDSQAIFGDGTIVLNPHFKGHIKINATYQKVECYNIWGFCVSSYWKEVS